MTQNLFFLMERAIMKDLPSINHYLSYGVIRLITLPFSWLPYPLLHRMGALFGLIAYHMLPHFRKRACSNLALASALQLQEKEIIRLAKESFQSLMITCLEYAKLSREKDLHKICQVENTHSASEILKSGKGVIFFCGHQANWELFFLEGTSRMPGVAIGRPLKNRPLYSWILSIRQKFGGKIIAPKNALREGLRALKSGSFLGIVGDQAMPQSGFRSLFLGKEAWTSPIAALLSYRTGSPIIVPTMQRIEGKYRIHYSDPIWPCIHAPLQEEIERLMGKTLALLEESITKTPGQWLWQHNRWKQQTLDKIPSRYRQEAICIILPEETKLFDEISPHLGTFREIYPLEFLTFLVPAQFCSAALLPEEEKIPYTSLSEILVRDFRFKLIFNLTEFKEVETHFKRLSAFTVLNWSDLHMQTGSDFSTLLKKTLRHAS